MAQIRPEMNLKNRLEFALSICSSRELKSRFIVNCVKLLGNRFAITFRDVNSNAFGEWVVTMNKLPKLTAHRALQHGLKQVINQEGAGYISLALRKLINLDKGLLVNSKGNKFCSAHSSKLNCGCS